MAQDRGCELVALAATLEGMFTTKGLYCASVVVFLLARAQIAGADNLPNGRFFYYPKSD